MYTDLIAIPFLLTLPAPFHIRSVHLVPRQARGSTICIMEREALASGIALNPLLKVVLWFRSEGTLYLHDLNRTGNGYACRSIRR